MSIIKWPFFGRAYNLYGWTMVNDTITLSRSALERALRQAYDDGTRFDEPPGYNTGEK